MNALPADPRRRNLIVLGALAGVVLLLALLAVWAQSTNSTAPKQSEFFPGLAPRVAHHEITHIHIESKANGTVDVAFRPSKGWVVVSRGSYPASFEQVQGTLVGLAAMQTIESKTSRPELLHYIGLDAPPRGDGVLVRASDEHGKPVAALIAGKTSDIGDASGATGLFARKEGSNQAWLVRSVNEIRSAPTDWMDKSVLDVERFRVREVDVTPLSGPAYSVSRAKPGDADFTLAPIPPGRQVSASSAPNATAESIVGFSFDDVQPAGQFNFTKGAAKLVTRTFDRLSVTVTTIKKGDDYWATVAASTDAPKAAKEAAAINAKAAGWAYKAASYKGAQFTAPLENLLKPKDTPAKTAP